MNSSKKLPITAAAAVIVILASLLAARVFDLDAAQDARFTAAETRVPEPTSIGARELSIPAWHTTASRDWSIDFKTDLDLLAPLGDGTANAAVWFAQFEKERGSRASEAEALLARRVEHAELGLTLPFDDPLLAEAEPWCDQSIMRFYPEIFPVEGWQTRIPNLLVPLSFARSWVARGIAAGNEDAAMADFRRAIRLGRLLRQDDAVLINDLVGLECIRLGAWGIFTATRDRDPERAMIAAIVIGEAAPQRLLSAERVTKVDLSPYARKLDDGSFVLEIPDRMIDTIESLTATPGDRRFKAEAIFAAQLISSLGTEAQRTRMVQLLDRIATGADPVLSALARWTRDHELPPEELAELLAG